MATVINGIFQGDIVVRSAVILALKEIRDNPSLIDDALASLPQDDLTSGRYGDKTIAECKRWFLATNIPVKLGLVLSQLTSPLISIEMNVDQEAESTLGDVHYDTSEADPLRYTVASNTATTITVNETIDLDLCPDAGNLTVGGNTYAYTGVTRATKTFTGLAALGALPAGGAVTFPLRRPLESVKASESYNITLLVQGEPEYLLFLYTLVLFGLLRRKSDLLESRGFARMTWNVGVAAGLDPSIREEYFIRTIRLNGYPEHSWPKYQVRTAPRGTIAEVPFGEMVARPDEDAVTPTLPDPAAPGSNPFDPADWADRDTLSGEKS